MDLSFTEEQQHLKDTARRLLAERAGSASLRTTIEGEAGRDPELWQELSESMGWTGILVPEAHDGLGLGPVELCAIMEEMGRALYSGPFFSSVCLAQNVLLACGDEAAHARHLPGLASGSTRAAVALTDADPEAAASARRDGDGFVLDGHKCHVVDGASAELLLVTATLDGHPAVFALDATAAGLERTATPTMDQTRRQARVVLSGVHASGDALIASGAGTAAALQLALDRARIALAAEQVGSAQACLDTAVEYAKTRTQFGRPIGSFQAIKHKCADMMTQLESARSACYYATAAAARADTTADELTELASLTQAFCSEAHFFCAGENIQVHGGIGFTWEHDAHLHFKRARASQTLLGDPAAHRSRIAERLLG